jgi:hypothetical protein
MQQLRLVRILLLPSLLSGCFCVLMACGTLLYANWIYLGHHGTLYDFLFGANGLSAPVQQISGNLLASLGKAFNSTAIYDVIVGVAAVVAGGITYIVLEGAHRAEVNTLRTVHELEATDLTHATDVRHETIAHLLVRTGVALIGGAYTVVLLKIILPSCIMWFRAGLRSPTSPHGSLTLVGATALLFVGLHVVVVFIRLLVLRPRLFGNNDAILSALH